MKLWKRPLLTTVLWATAFVAGYFGYNYSQDTQFARAEEKREEVRKGLAHAEDLATAFRDVGRVVGPSVVNINVRKKVTGVRMPNFFHNRIPGPNDNGDEGDMPDFRLPGPLPGPGDQDGGLEQIGTGSGVIMEVDGSKGYILTNNHVAGGAEEMIITLADGRQIKSGKLVGADAKTDLAVVAITADRLSPAKWGNSDELQKGDWIMAFGSPFGYVGSMTHGIVSALNRTEIGILGQGGYESFIQVDAPINPGNSGGPLVNLRGEVVGVNTAIASRSGGFQGIGFAIPSNQAKVIYNILKDKGKVVRGWLGVSIADVSNPEVAPVAKSFGWDKDNGVLVQEVLPGTPAVGKLQQGDVITEVNGKTVETVQKLRNAIAALPPASNVAMKVFREGKTDTVNIKLAEQPEDLAAARNSKEPANGGATTSPSAMGIHVRTLTAGRADQLGLQIRSGALVNSVDRNSPAARKGIGPGDVITKVGRTTITSADDFTAAMKKEDTKKGVALYVVSRDGGRYVFLSTEE